MYSFSVFIVVGLCRFIAAKIKKTICKQNEIRKCKKFLPKYCVLKRNAYFCSMNRAVREILYSEEYKSYYNGLDSRIQTKYDYVEQIIRTQYVVNEKFVKHLGDTDFYEARVSVGTNEYRTILFAIETRSFMESKRVLFLNSFLKKDNRQYKKEIKIAEGILAKYVKEDEK